jgi:formylglycine-generating enzyme required for sulfatase activity
LDPENVDTINSRGIAYHRLKKYPEAINDYTRAIEMNPSEADIYCNRGLSFSDLGRHELALGDYIQAIRLNPSHEKARIYLKKARHQLKDTHYLNITKINQVKSLEIPNKSKFFIYICIWIIVIFSGIGLIPNYFYSIETSIEKGMVLIPPGTFFMGSLITEKERETRHAVTLTKPFYLSKYEVTQEQWQVVMGNNPSSKAREAKLPVTDVSWNDCQEFIKKLNAKTNGGYRLPTEAEWEYACRAGTTTEYSFGDSLTKSDANYGDGEAGRIKLGGSYKPNAFGLYDMHGNVFEWCEDWNGEYPLVSVKDPKGPVVGEIRVMRGGSFLNDASKASSSYRSNAGSPSLGFFNAGFRLARTVVSDGVKESKKEIKIIFKIKKKVRLNKIETQIFYSFKKKWY